MKLCHFEIGQNRPFFLIAGPCVIESEDLVMTVAGTLQTLTATLGIPFIFKASFDKANRTSDQNFRGLGFEKGLTILAKVKKTFQIPVLTDVHENTPLDQVAQVVDILQTPAFLCRQTDFLHRVAKAGKPVNVKKGQFLAPQDMAHVVQKLKNAGNSDILVCERGTCFGYHNLVVDMRSLAIMRDTKCPVVFDATHSVQLPGGGEGASGGQREFVPVLARAAAGVGVDGFFMETHPNPEKALSDGPNMWPLSQMGALLETLKEIDCVAKSKLAMQQTVSV